MTPDPLQLPDTAGPCDHRWRAVGCEHGCQRCLDCGLVIRSPFPFTVGPAANPDDRYPLAVRLLVVLALVATAWAIIVWLAPSVGRFIVKLLLP